VLIHVLTIFPRMFDSPLGESIIGRALARGLVRVETVDIRNYCLDKHRCVDDYPFGGGAGMVMKPEPIFRAVEHVCSQTQDGKRVILLSPAGKVLTQSLVHDLAKERHLVLICGHYEGVDDRVRQHLVTDEISIGDYVLTGGELPAMVIIDAVVRLIPGVLGDAHSVSEESFAGGLLEYPHYTRPRDFRGMTVPEVLLSGNHRLIRQWRRKQSLYRTLRNRPELLDKAQLDEEDRRLVALLEEEAGQGL